MLAFEEDYLTLDLKDNSGRWVVELNNGQIVYQDDGKDGASHHSAWVRLNEYCKENQLYIVGMYLQFRSHIEHIAKNADGYFFAKSVMAGFGSQQTWHFYLVGTLENGILRVDTWKLPELIVQESEIRNVNDCSINLIRREK